jgi:shikimate dehydrogenase
MTDKYAQHLNIDRYAVLGNPIAHSKSPLIHAEFAKQTAQNISYEAILAPLDGFAVTVQDLAVQGFKGANVTVPFKFEAFALCDNLSDRAFAAGAVNTLTFENGKINGDNTDGAGLINDITLNLGVALQAARILLLGAGGAAQGVLLPLLNEQPASITIANRSLEKAHFMAQKMAAQHAVCNITISNYENLDGQFDVIINATSTGLSDTALPIPDAIFAKNCLAYDMMYGRETPFMAQARANGAQVADGLGMLVAQAAEAFYIWRGVRPQTAPVITALRSY